GPRRRRCRAPRGGQPARSGARPVKSGFSVVEALVALVLTAVALAALTPAAASRASHVRLARDRGCALQLASPRLGSLPAGPPTRAADEGDDAGTRFARPWHSDDGRGGADRLHVEVTWPGGRLELESGAFP